MITNTRAKQISIDLEECGQLLVTNSERRELIAQWRMRPALSLHELLNTIGEHT